MNVSLNPRSNLSSFYNSDNMLRRHISLKWTQRSRLFWVHDGDLNTTFFHSYAHINRCINTIIHIFDCNANTYFDRDGIESVFLNFYTQLWANAFEYSFTSLLHAFPPNLPYISSSDRDLLTRNVIKIEIYNTLMSLPSSKNPGPDGFNVVFYKLFWHDIEDSLFNVIN